MPKYLAALFVILVAGCIPVPSNDFEVTFHDVACIKPFKGYHYLTCKNLDVSINHITIIIPQDYQTDLASIPRWLWPFVAPTNSSFIAPSILHDYLYSCKGYTRREADDIFYRALIKNEVNMLRAYEMYLAVRIFGGKHYECGF
ncbi:Campylobacter phage CGC-2007, Cje0229 [uncultured Caudovirales phage]|uniref:Campylobacter phage CGC-2007, Cje0229 n=1 Tax=uncultured Caudovirales phage TaxID=2100421 RepID=A0A6J5MVS2_9CAUD|nr:Campylobacter phage CGC-2007, Cje0229 [uncultured Caudovirales phage]CAB4167359.1 Campylobacter phage CGC-2007, Cje0229 [uncultured Caudovirales phage]CAB4173544.1 Campylobacter phage CGC-2007, Cje0229 [uncultured Caudovirales phage]CAB4178804.1 Campylobacter phage CGC-2007, Cje0229 [uncultured Caudovirales phage]CAB4188605.1 Campylobacter phage CGC-2007, Cje0229 [uncultured Caudovirales phage]